MRTLIIYGAAERGRELKETLAETAILYPPDRIFFCDGNEELQGTTVDDAFVLSPEGLDVFDKQETSIIIASALYYEIFSRIRHYGFLNIFRLDNDDEIVRFDEPECANHELNRLRRMVRERVQELVAFETYKYIADEKYKQGTLFDSPFFGFDRHLHEFVDKHKDKRCFILGNGPSLNKTDVTLLKDEITFGTNMIFKAFPMWGFPVTYWCIEDELIFLQYYNEIVKGLPNETVKFMSMRLAYMLTNKSELENVVPFNINYKPDTGKPHPFSFPSVPSEICHGAATSCSMLQIAAIMGCNPIYLIGLDHNFPKQKENQVAERYYHASDKDDHFIPMERNGALGFIHQLERSTAAFEQLAKDLIKRGIQVYNASPGTKLEAFPKINYEDIIK